MNRSIVAIAVFVACACSSSTPVAATTPETSPSSAAAPTPASTATPAAGTGVRYAIIAGTDGMLRLIGPRGEVAATVDLHITWNRPNVSMPISSASLTRVYYLDDNGAGVRYVQPDGSTGLATQIQLKADEVAGFAVSPDDRRIAVSVFSFTPYPPGGFPTYLGMRLYVEDLAGGGHHVDIFTSTNTFEFPLGWVGGRLVMAVSLPLCCGQLQPNPNPYGAIAYHVVNPDTGQRLVTLCGTGGQSPMGPFVQAGVMCGPGEPRFQRWDGTAFSPPAAVPSTGDRHVALSPDGTHVAVGGAPIRILAGASDSQLNINGDALGWVDGIHVVVSEDGGENGWLLDSRTSIGVQLTGVAAFFGALPAAIS